MNDQANYFKLGLFVLCGVAVIVAAFLVLSAGVVFRKEIMLETYFKESVYGLSAGSDVVYRGVTVGKVDAISFTAVHYELNKPLDARKPYVLVRFIVYPALFGDLSPKQTRDLIAAWTKRGLRVQREPQGLTGLSYLGMDFAQQPSSVPGLPIDWKPKYPYVPSVPNVFGTVSETIKSVRATLDQIQKMNIPKLAGDVDDLVTTTRRSVDQAKLGDLASETRQALAGIRSSSDQLRAMLASPVLARTLQDARATAGSAREIADAGAKSLPQILGNISHTADALRKSSADLPQTVEDLNASLRSLSALLDQQRQTVAETLQNLQAASRNIRDLTEKANQYPAGTLLGAPPAPVHPGEKP